DRGGVRLDGRCASGRAGHSRRAQQHPHRRVVAAVRDTSMTVGARDPIRTELLKNALAAVADEMAVTVIRTARSAVVKDAMDFSTGLIDQDGELIAQGLCLPLHMGSFPPAMAVVQKEFGGDMHPGDVYA